MIAQTGFGNPAARNVGRLPRAHHMVRVCPRAVPLEGVASPAPAIPAPRAPFSLAVAGRQFHVDARDADCDGDGTWHARCRDKPCSI